MKEYNMKETIEILIDCLKELVNEIVGQNMSIGRLYDFIKKSEVSDKLIILLILLMSDEEVLKKKVWVELSHSFFRKYRKQIFTFCGYGKNKYGIEQIKVNTDYRNLFLDCIGCMLRNEIITGCSSSKMAKIIHELFDIGYARSTILNKLKDENPDFEELNNMIYSEKKRIKSNKENNNK